MLRVAIALVVPLGLTGLATDLGLLWTERRQIRTAAYAAAVAGALTVGSGSNLASDAQKESSVNGFTAGRSTPRRYSFHVVS
jgi:uncharacterized membrane protein